MRATSNFKSSLCSSRYLAASLKLLNSSTTSSSLYAMHGCLADFFPLYLPLSCESFPLSDAVPSLRFSGRKSRRLSCL
ncbi:hypothetical protein AR158_c807R [Paramecium bursaria Chlorella virus AR158]|uniref:hypothetical protein n=1 Tax=Paramecium bursaria Chlorella virus AR158 TaxID=380598 RepID=UPI00015AA911|nr:hypothetical protein AR158_c807R [Paramecium bursaria Chlorella virus AR158]ABU44352.1 hypothetical protein AR158_c807R [Paramecium bursaria Chlorella virus AR158]